MAGPITTGSFPKALWPGVHAWWGLNYDEHGMECNDLFDATDSQKAYEEIVEAIGMGLAPIKSEGSSVAYDSMQQGVTNRFVNVAYGLGFIITREEKDDNQYEQLAYDRAQRLGFSMRSTKENVGANFYNNAFTTTFGDGVSLISTAHPVKAGTQSNRLTTDADLSEASIEDMMIQIEEAKDSAGLRVAYRGNSLHIHPDNMFEAERILGSVLQNDTANNAVNALKSKGVLAGGVKVNHYFTDRDAWFVRTNAPKGLILFNRVGAEFTEDNDFDTENMKAKAYERYSFGFGDWRGVYGTSGA